MAMSLALLQDVRLQNVYWCCAAAGGALLVLQTLASLVGMGHHNADGGFGDAHDHEPGHADGDTFVKFFTLKSVVAFVTFFGLTGLACEWRQMAASATLVIALLAGAAALWAVAWVMSSLAKLQSRGNVRLENAVGLAGKVYLRIPPHREGLGKVTVTVQSRTMELKAVTRGAELPSGAPIRVVAMHAPDTFEVAALTES